jgi:hypothetical protein
MAGTSFASAKMQDAFSPRFFVEGIILSGSIACKVDRAFQP